MNEVKINKNQARSIATIIFEGIEEYVSNHQEEFKAFLKEEEMLAQMGGKN